MRNTKHNHDEELFTEESFSLFFKEWFPSVVYFALRITKEQQAAEDIAEDAFLALWERRENFDHIKMARAFLYTTARNASLNRLRSKKIAAKNGKQIAFLSDAVEMHMLEEMIRAELVHELNTAIAGLPAQCKKILGLLYVDGKNNSEAAKELNLSVNTIKAQRARGLSILRKKLRNGFLLLFINL